MTPSGPLQRVYFCQNTDCFLVGLLRVETKYTREAAVVPNPKTMAEAKDD